MSGVAPKPRGGWRRSRRRPSRFSPAFRVGFPAGLRCPLQVAGVGRGSVASSCCHRLDIGGHCGSRTSPSSCSHLHDNLPAVYSVPTLVLFSAPFPERAQQNSYLRAKRNAERGAINTFIREDFTSFPTEIFLTRFCRFKSFFHRAGAIWGRIIPALPGRCVFEALGRFFAAVF